MSHSDGVMRQLWEHPWGRTLLISATIAAVSWAVRETAVITEPIFGAISSVAVPLALGFTLAYVLTPAIDWLQRRGLSRIVSTSVLFIFLILISILTMVLVLPAIVVQTTDIIKRSVEDSYFYDKNADGVYSTGEPIVRPIMVDDKILYFHDANNNGVKDNDETVYSDEDFSTLSKPVGIVKEPSFIEDISNLVDGYQADVESWVGAEPNEQSLAFVVFYLEQSRSVRDLIGRGLSIENSSDDAWQRWLQEVVALTGSTPAETNQLLDWQRNWPGVVIEELKKSEALIPEARRQDWAEHMALLGSYFAKQHQQNLNQWQKVRTGQAAQADPALLQLIQEDLDGASRGEAMDYIKELRQHRKHSTSRDLLIAISGSSSDDSRGVLQDIVLGVNSAVQEKMAKMPEYTAEYAGELLTNIDALLMFGLNVFLVPVYAFFLCLAMPTIRSTAKAYIPIKGHDRTLRIIQKIEAAVAAFFRGRLIVCVICAFLTWIGFAVLQIPYAALFGVLIGLATAIPMAGLVFLVPAVLLTMIEGGDNIALRASLAIVVYGAVQTLEATVFTPTIMGKEVELHPVLLLVALLLCGNLLGILGLILAVPIAATVRIFAREFFLPRIREAAGVPDTVAIRRKSTGPIQTQDIIRPENEVSSGQRRSVETEELEDYFEEVAQEEHEKKDDA